MIDYMFLFVKLGDGCYAGSYFDGLSMNGGAWSFALTQPSPANWGTWIPAFAGMTGRDAYR